MGEICVPQTRFWSLLVSHTIFNGWIKEVTLKSEFGGSDFHLERVSDRQ